MRALLTSFLILVGIAAAMYAAMCLFLYLQQDRVLFYPRTNDRSLLERWAPYRIEIPSGEHALEGFWTENGASKSSRILVYFGGNAEDVLYTASTSFDLAVKRMLVVNYRGYGGTPGTPSQEALYEDALAIYEYVVASGTDPNDIVVMGRSLGSGLATMLASERKVRSAILITPYDSLAEVAAHHYPIFPVRLLMKHPFDSAPFAQRATVPALMLAAEHDTIIPPTHAQRLHDLWAGPRQLHILNGVGHNDIERSSEYYALINAFLAE
jgi:pimeloyl-ACP methyl ester carboxylesterase